MKKERTSNANSIDVLRLNALALEDVVHLRASAMEDDRVETETIKEAKAECEFLEVVKNSAANFDDSKFCGL